MSTVLSGMGVVHIAHDEDKYKVSGEGGGCGNHIEDNDNNNDVVGKGILLLSYSLCNVRVVVLVNMGANHNLAKLFCFSSLSSASSPSGGSAIDVRCYMLDCC